MLNLKIKTSKKKLNNDNINKKQLNNPYFIFLYLSSTNICHVFILCISDKYFSDVYLL